MRTILVFLFVCINSMIMAQSDVKIIYVGDPMCSWCYGIAPEYTKLLDEFEGKASFELVMGGLRPYNQQKMPELKSFLTEHWHEVYERSGQEFNYDILDNASLNYDTEPPSRATVVVRAINPKQEIAFFKKSQVLFYLDNKNMELAESYYELLDELGIDKTQFTELFNSDEMKQAIKADFARAGELGVNSFPTILLEYEGKYHAIARGYSTADKMIKRIEDTIK